MEFNLENHKLKSIVLKLEKYIENEKYMGWDPYDALNSEFINKLTSFHPFVQRIAIHLLKNSPINFRNILGIKKGYNPTALSLFIDGYVNLYHIYGDSEYLKKANFLKEKLYFLTCINNQEELGWGRNFKFITTKETHELDKPLTFLNAKLSISLLNLYEITKEKLIIKNTKKVIFSIIKNGRVFETKEGTFIGYSADSEPRYIFNASILTAELIVKYLYHTKQNDEIICNISLKNLAEKLIDTVLVKQQDDGKWYYGYNFDFTILKNIDFHQGFVSDALLGISKYFDYKKEEILKAYTLGIEFMYENQISNNGRFKWRLPKEYPVDIHNQAQGIISLARVNNDKYNPKLNTLLKYTIEEFFDNEKGYFYYQKNRFYTIKIPFIRWGEGWMFFALTEYLKVIKDNK
jgi:hypothetical protein